MNQQERRQFVYDHRTCVFGYPRKAHGPAMTIVYYVMNGDGTAQVNGEHAPIHKGDAIPILFNDVHSFENNSNAELEFMIVGIARQKFVLDTSPVK